jgi:integrase
MRGQGRIFKRRNSAHYWISYCHRGKEHRESSGSPDHKVAERLLKQRLREIGADRLGLKAFVGPAQERITFQDLKRSYLQDYEVRGLRSRETAAARVKHLESFFGTDRVVDITPARLRAYQAARLEDKAQAGTVNRELSALHRMFQLAVKTGIVSTPPAFPERLEENPPRQGFFEHEEYLVVRQHLPPDYQDVLEFAYFTGWRRREITGLTWAEVDLAGGVVRLSPDRSKTKTGRVLPLSSPLRNVLARRWSARLIDHRGEIRVTDLVFHKRGQPIGDWRKTWDAACKAAGLPHKRLHDCRRTAARNLVRAGVPERVAMAVLGHKTRSIFDRYNIVSETDLRQATARLAEYVGQQPTEPTVVAFPKASDGSAR